YRTEGTMAHTDPNGEWRRARSVVRNWITPDGSAGPTGDGGFKAEPGRYHLYVAWNCPWAHRTLLARILKGLEAQISISIARPRRTDQGWVHDSTGEYVDPLYGVAALHEAYQRTVAGYTGGVTVPLLVDRQSGSAVSNESADIVRMLNGAFGSLSEGSADLYPDDLAGEIDRWNERIYRTVNNGVYRAGFASTQSAYEEAAQEVFDAFDAIDRQLGETRYLTGDQFTEADLRLFPTLVRFDVAYHYAFRCNLRKISDYAHLWPYARAIYQMPGVAQTVKFDIYKRGYFSPSEKRNPLGIVPIGPALPDWDAPHER
ncbi:MAG: glutathione S-transferase family protein, partial [Alphaproteobacteria bacterium]